MQKGPGVKLISAEPVCMRVLYLPLFISLRDLILPPLGFICSAAFSQSVRPYKRSYTRTYTLRSTYYEKAVRGLREVAGGGSCVLAVMVEKVGSDARVREILLRAGGENYECVRSTGSEGGVYRTLSARASLKNSPRQWGHP